MRHIQRGEHVFGSQLLLLCCLLPLLIGCSAMSSGQPAALTVQHAPQSAYTYVAIGASDTFGIGTDDPLTESWPADLASQLGSTIKNVRLVNLGIPGIDVDKAIHVELPVALDAHPALVTIWLAVNDLADNVPLPTYAQDLDLLIGSLQAENPQVRIAVANVPDLAFVPHFQSVKPQVLAAQVAAYNQQIATIVQRHHVLLVDLYQRWQELATHPEYISDDGFHPSTLGYEQIANIFYQVLTETQ
jgi:lysophospholipase L1-like esterase